MKQYLLYNCFIMYICAEMIQLRVDMIEQYIKKKRSFADIKAILGKSTKTIRQRIAKFKKHGSWWLQPKKPWPKKWSPANRTKKEIEYIVCELAKKHRFKWPIQLWFELEDHYWVKLHYTTIFRILRRNWVRYHQYYKMPKKKPTLYVKQMPGQEVQLDVCFPYGYSRKTYTYNAIDDCTRNVVSKTYDKHNQDATIEFINYLIQTAPYPIKAIRTDQGFEFWRRVTEFLASKWIEHIKNPAYTPENNGKVERYHKTWKQEYVCWRPYTRTLDEINYHNQLWLHYYNNERRHTWLGMNGLTPIQKLKQSIKEMYYFEWPKCHLNSATE